MSPDALGRWPKRPRMPLPERRAAILTALEQILETTPLLAVTVKQLAREAGCATTTIYQHFDGLSEAAAALVKAKRAAAQEAGEDAITDQHLAAIDQLFTVEADLTAA